MATERKPSDAVHLIVWKQMLSYVTMGLHNLIVGQLYKTLGVHRFAAKNTIKQEYTILVRHLHPDRTKGNSQIEELIQVSWGYRQLSYEPSRALYGALSGYACDSAFEYRETWDANEKG